MNRLRLTQRGFCTVQAILTQEYRMYFKGKMGIMHRAERAAVWTF